MKIFIFLLCVLLFVSPALGDETDRKMLQAMTQAGFSKEQVVQVQTQVKSAQQQGLPSETISGKVYEGIAKGVAPERIVRALTRVTSRYQYGYGLAQALTREKKQIAELGTTMAEGVAAGLTPRDTEKIVGSLQTRSSKMNKGDLYLLAEEAMRTARDLSRQGVSSAATVEVVGGAVDKGFDAAGMQTMRGSFNAQGRYGNVESLARGYGRAIEQGVSPQGLADQAGSSRGAGGRHGAGEGSGGGNSGGSSGGSGGDGGGGSGGSEGSGGSGDSGDSGGSGGAGGSGSGGGSGGSGNGGGGGGGNSGGSGNGGGRH